MDDFRTDKIMVTGALGWLGLSLVDALANGLPGDERLQTPRRNLRIRCIVLPGQDPAPLRKISSRVEVFTGDISNAADCTRLCQDFRGAVLFHTAGLVHARKVKEFYQINVDGTVRLMEAAIRAGVRRAIVISSNSPCGCNPRPDHLFDEESPYHPYMNYGRSKMQMELAVKKRQQQGSIEAVIVRPCWFYGPNQPPRQTLFFNMIRDGKAPIVGSGNSLRSMSYIENLVQGLLLTALVDKANGQTYWLADRRPYSMNEIIDTIERLLETEFGVKCAHRRLRLPGIASEVAFMVDATLQAMGLYHQKIHVLSEMNKTIACSVAKAERELGYNPRIELEEGMRRSFGWCKAQGIQL